MESAEALDLQDSALKYVDLFFLLTEYIFFFQLWKQIHFNSTLYPFLFFIPTVVKYNWRRLRSVR